MDYENCPGPDCMLCANEACNLCGAGCWRGSNYDAPPCEHDVLERHMKPFEKEIPKKLEPYDIVLALYQAYWVAKAINQGQENKNTNIYQRAIQQLEDGYREHPGLSLSALEEANEIFRNAAYMTTPEYLGPIVYLHYQRDNPGFTVWTDLSEEEKKRWVKAGVGLLEQLIFIFKLPKR